MGKIMVTTKIERKIDPDRCRISLTVRAEEKTSQKAAVACRERCEKLLSKLNAVGFPPENIELADDRIAETTDYQTHTVNYYSKRTLRLDTAADVRIVNVLRGIIEDEKDDAELSTSYYLSNEDELRKELLNEAITASRAKAELFAASANAKVIGVHTANLDGTEEIFDIPDDEDDEDDDSEDFCEMVSLFHKEKNNLSDKLKPSSVCLKVEIKIVWLLFD